MLAVEVRGSQGRLEMHLLALVSSIHCHWLQPWAVLYIGPDVFLPITSAIAAVAGFLLMFWHRLVSLFRKLWRLVFRPKG